MEYPNGILMQNECQADKKLIPKEVYTGYEAPKFRIVRMANECRLDGKHVSVRTSR